MYKQYVQNTHMHTSTSPRCTLLLYRYVGHPRIFLNFVYMYSFSLSLYLLNTYKEFINNTHICTPTHLLDVLYKCVGHCSLPKETQLPPKTLQKRPIKETYANTYNIHILMIHTHTHTNLADMPCRFVGYYIYNVHMKLIHTHV